MKGDETLERMSRLRQLEVDPVECEMEEAAVGGGEGEDVDVARTCASHYGVFNDLFGNYDSVVYRAWLGWEEYERGGRHERSSVAIL